MLLQKFYGRRAVLEILRSHKPVAKLLLAQGIEPAFAVEAEKLARSRGARVERLPREAMDRLVKGNHQGVVLESGEPFESNDFRSFLEEVRGDSRALLCLLDEIQDPQNLGAILRNAVCFGARGALITRHRSAGLTGAVMRASSGAAAHLPLIQVPNLVFAMEKLKEAGFTVYGADTEGEPLASAQIDFPAALVLGNEHSGLRPLVRRNCDRLLQIPQSERIASLNVSAASAIFLYELSRRSRA